MTGNAPEELADGILGTLLPDVDRAVLYAQIRNVP